MQTEKKNFFKENPLLSGVSIIIIVAFSAVLVFLYNQNRDLRQKLQRPNAAVKDEVNSLIAALKKHIELPNDEEPTVATVSDAEKLKNQPFFAGAVKGDKVLIYTNAKKAILYRPSSDKIIEVAPVNLGAQPAATSSASAIQKPLRIALYNGTKTTGLTKKAENALKVNIKEATVVARENANNDYEKTTVALLSTEKSREAALIADFFGVAVANFPQRESKPDADILVILGSDYVSK